MPPEAALLFSVHDFETGNTMSYKGSERVFPPSLIKVLFLKVFMEELQDDRLLPDVVVVMTGESCFLDAPYTLTELYKYAGETLIEGMGNLQHMPASTTYTYKELLNC